MKYPFWWNKWQRKTVFFSFSPFFSFNFVSIQQVAKYTISCVRISRKLVFHRVLLLTLQSSAVYLNGNGRVKIRENNFNHHFESDSHVNKYSKVEPKFICKSQWTEKCWKFRKSNQNRCVFVALIFALDKYFFLLLFGWLWEHVFRTYI